MYFFGYKFQKVTQNIGAKIVKVTQTFYVFLQTLKLYKSIPYK